MVWDSDSAALKALQLKHPDLKAHEVDVTNESNVVDATLAAFRAFGRPDILVNAAGIAGGRRKLVDSSLAEWEQVLRVNLTGTFLCCREIAALVAWMCPEECSFTTGFAFDLSGGRAIY